MRHFLLLLPVLFFTAGLYAADFAGGTGTIPDPYRISNAAQLENLHKYVGEEHADNYYILMADIDLSGINWFPVGYDGRPFHGKLDGKRRKILNLNIDPNEEKPYVGLFGLLGDGAEVINLHIAAGEIIGSRGAAYAGAIAGYAHATEKGIRIRNCTNDCHITGSFSIEGTSLYTGGIIGYVYAEGARVDILDCVNNGNINGGIMDGVSMNTGGFIGYGHSSVFHGLCIMYCYNNGNIISGNASNSNTGGIVGTVYGDGALLYPDRVTYIFYTTNMGYIMGGISWESNTGGIIGYTHNEGNSSTHIQRCMNGGNITGGEGDDVYTGGILGHGWVSDSNSGIGLLYINECYSHAIIHALTGYAGGLVGRTPYIPSGFYSNEGVYNCYVAGSIVGNAYASGLVGYSNMELSSSVAALTSIQGRSTSRIGDIGRNYANQDMLLNGNKTTSSDANSHHGIDISMGDLFKEATYTATTMKWDFERAWAIRSDQTSLPYFNGKPTPVVVENLTATNARLNIEEASDSIRIYKHTMNGKQYLSTILFPDKGSKSYPVNVNQNDTIIFINHQGMKSVSYPVMATVAGSGVGIEHTVSTDIKIYPNPVEDHFIISGLTSLAQLRVFDFSGRIVLSRQVVENEYVPFEKYASGIYIMTLHMKEGNYTRKLIKK